MEHVQKQEESQEDHMIVGEEEGNNIHKNFTAGGVTIKNGRWAYPISSSRLLVVFFSYH